MVDELMTKATSVAKGLLGPLPSPEINLKKKQITDEGGLIGDFPGKGRAVDYTNQYIVTTDGFIWSIKRNMWVAQTLTSNGYKKVDLWESGLRKNFRVHRLVALAHIPNPDNKPYINHKDGDKLNNHISNLEWVTAQENTDHAKGLGLMWYQKK